MHILLEHSSLFISLLDTASLMNLIFEKLDKIIEDESKRTKPLRKFENLARQIFRLWRLK